MAALVKVIDLKSISDKYKTLGNVIFGLVKGQ